MRVLIYSMVDPLRGKRNKRNEKQNKNNRNIPTSENRKYSGVIILLKPYLLEEWTLPIHLFYYIQLKMILLLPCYVTILNWTPSVNFSFSKYASSSGEALHTLFCVRQTISKRSATCNKANGTVFFFSAALRIPSTFHRKASNSNPYHSTISKTCHVCYNT